MIKCDQGYTTDPAECLRFHESAIRSHIMDQKTGRPEKLRHCRCCPVAIELKEKKPMAIPGPYMQGVCPGCKEEKSILRNKGICQGCLRKSKPAEAAASKPASAKAKVEWVTEGAKLALDFSKHPWIHEALIKLADTEMRSVEAQAMWLLQHHLVEKRP